MQDGGAPAPAQPAVPTPPTPSPARRPRALLAAALALCTAGSVAAMDPMRPLPGMPGYNAGHNAGATPALPAAASTREGTPPALPGTTAAPRETAATEPQLRALRSDAQGRRDALIDDRWVRAGDSTPWGRVVAVHADHVVLATGPRRAAAEPDTGAAAAGRRSLYLLPRLLPTLAEGAEAPAPSRTRQR